MSSGVVRLLGSRHPMSRKSILVNRYNKASLTRSMRHIAPYLPIQTRLSFQMHISAHQSNVGSTLNSVNSVRLGNSNQIPRRSVQEIRLPNERHHRPSHHILTTLWPVFCHVSGAPVLFPITAAGVSVLPTRSPSGLELNHCRNVRLSILSPYFVRVIFPLDIVFFLPRCLPVTGLPGCSAFQMRAAFAWAASSLMPSCMNLSLMCS